MLSRLAPAILSCPVPVWDAPEVAGVKKKLMFQLNQEGGPQYRPIEGYRVFEDELRTFFKLALSFKKELKMRSEILYGNGEGVAMTDVHCHGSKRRQWIHGDHEYDSPALTTTMIVECGQHGKPPQESTLTTFVDSQGRLHYGPGPLNPRHKRWVITAVYQPISTEVDNEFQLYEPVEAFDAVSDLNDGERWRRVMRSTYIKGFKATVDRVPLGPFINCIKTGLPRWRSDREEQAWAETAEIQERYKRWNIQVLQKK